MIDVKGSKTKTDPKDSADAYRLKSDQAASPVPLVLGGFFAAIVIYIKTMFGEAEAAPVDDPGAGGALDGSQPVAPTTDVMEPAPAEEPTGREQAQNEQEPLPVQEAISFSGTNVVSLFRAVENLKATTQSKDQPTFESNDPFDQWQRLQQQVPADSDNSEDRMESVATDDAQDTQRGKETQPDRAAGPVNAAPAKSRAVYLSDIISGGILFIALSDLLKHSSDADGDVLAVINISVSGGRLETVDGGYNYYPDPGTAGQVQISYQVSDGQAAITQMAHFAVLHRPVVGSDADDALIGTPHADAIDGLAGDDNILGNGGQDVIRGGDGDDHIVGGMDDDIIYGGAGDDVIFGLAGDDQISGDTGDDEIYGGDGADVLLGGEGADAIAGDDGDDLLSGDQGDDMLDGGAGADLVIGGAGDDIMIGNADGADDVYIGGQGTDTIDYGATVSGITISLQSGIAESDETGTDILDGVEVAIGGSGGDTIVGSDGDDVLSGMAGDDLVAGGAGDDVIDGGSGDDFIDGGAGSDIVIAGTGNDLVMGTLDQANDTYSGGAGMDTLDYSDATLGLVFDMGTGTVTGAETGTDQATDFEVLVAGDGDDLFLIATGTGRITITGNDGDDDYHFLRGLCQADTFGQQHGTIVEITDFAPGDMITTDRFRIYDRDHDDDDDDDSLDSALSIQTTPTEQFADVNFWHEWRDDDEFTVVRIDEDQFDDFYEAYLLGHINIGITANG